MLYKIFCNNCEVSYVGQTKRKLKTRLNEHIADINKKTDSSSVITDHRINYNIILIGKILDKKPSYNKRLISEMVYIKK